MVKIRIYDNSWMIINDDVDSKCELEIEHHSNGNLIGLYCIIIITIQKEKKQWLMKKEVPPFGVLSANYDPNYHVIV